MSLAANIIACMKDGYADKSIAAIYGCSEAYVRAVRSRAKNKEMFGTTESPADRQKLNKKRNDRYANDPVYREQHKARSRIFMREFYRRKKNAAA